VLRTPRVLLVFCAVAAAVVGPGCGDEDANGAGIDTGPGTGTGSDGGPGGGEGGGGTIGAGCPVFPGDNPWNRDVSGDPVDPRSDEYMAHMGAASAMLHPDFGSDPTYGIPWISVPKTQARVPITFDYADESDPGPYPIPMSAPIEGGSAGDGDRHVIAIDSDDCKLYELFDAHPGSNAWTAGSGAIFDLRSNKLRPEGFTSADAAGLPIFPGLVRYEEAVTKGVIEHALRFTVKSTQNAYVHPATHAASSVTDPAAPPMGLRVRVKASYDISKLTGASKVIATAMKKYGMLLADNGSNWYISGETQAKWDDDDLSQLKKLPASAFEVVKLDTILKNPP
jgi:hypothetical protein